MRKVLPLTGLLLLLLAAPAARADRSGEILRDCVDGQIDGSYSSGDLKDARNDIPSDIDEYSDCRGALDAAIDDQAIGARGNGGGGGGTGGPGGQPDPASNPDPLNPAEQRAITAAEEAAGRPVRLGAAPGAPTALPGDTGLPAADVGRSLPSPLLVALILVGTVALLGLVLAARARVLARRSA